MKRLLYFIVFTLYFLIPAHTYAATYYIDPSGDDSNPGTQSEPFATIQNAANIVNPGDEVIVKDGTYEEQVVISRSGTEEEPIIFRSENKWGARLLGSDTDWRGLGFYVQSASHIRISDFEITQGGTGIHLNGPSSTIDTILGPNNITITGNHIHNVGRICESEENSIPRNGIYAGNSQNLFIHDNVIHDVGRLRVGQDGCTDEVWSGVVNFDHGIYIRLAKNVQITNNIVYRNLAGWGVHFFGGSGDAIENALIAHNTFAIPNPSRVGFVILSINNKNIQIVNNLFYKPNQAGVDLYSDRTYENTVIEYNLIDDGISHKWRADSVEGLTAQFNLENADASLTDPDGYDYSLSADSEAIDEGLTIEEVECSIENVSRPQGLAYDIGAYEYSSEENPLQCGETPSPSPSPSPTPAPTPTPSPTASPTSSPTATTKPKSSSSSNDSTSTSTSVTTATGFTPSSSIATTNTFSVISTPVPTSTLEELTQQTSTNGDGVKKTNALSSNVDHVIASEIVSVNDGESLHVIYLKFDLRGVKRSAHKQITFQYRVAANSPSQRNLTQKVRFVPDNDWEESSLTARNMPERTLELSTLTDTGPHEFVIVSITDLFHSQNEDFLSIAIETNGTSPLLIDRADSLFPPQLQLSLEQVPTCAGDVNSDGAVNLRDLSHLISSTQSSVKASDIFSVIWNLFRRCS